MGDQTVDGIEAKYISGLSTIMVATIQEAKDRISQIEYIFCSQLFPSFQSKSKTLEKLYSEARLAACDAWREREKALLSQIEEIKLENQHIKSENLALVKDKEKLYEELDKLVTMPLRLSNLEDYVVRLKLKVKKRSKEAEDGRELHDKLVQLLEVKGSDMVSEDEIDMILSQVKSLKTKTEFLQEELSKKTLVTENLLKKLEHLSTEAADSLEQEKQRLTTRLQIVEENVDRLEELVTQKSNDLEERGTVLEVLQAKLNLTERELLDCKQKFAEIAREKEKTVVVMGKEVEEKSCELAMEIKKRKEAYSAYKRLKSQYNFLCKKFGLTAESVLHQIHHSEEETSNQMGQHERPLITSSLERKNSDNARVSSGNNNEKEESVIKTVQTPTTSISPIVRPHGVRSDPTGAKSPQLRGLKRPASIWRDTRSRQSPGGGHDPHDDFLDTPIENVKRVAVEAKKHVDDDAGKKEDDDSDDDETQDLNNPKPSPSKPVAETSKKSYKHVEVVRKKAEREKLKGIECKQCKKFYDAVLPDGNNGNGKSLRCEHHEGVSRHRYRYAPPMTPEGFWNIGFESEM